MKTLFTIYQATFLVIANQSKTFKLKALLPAVQAMSLALFVHSLLFSGETLL